MFPTARMRAIPCPGRPRGHVAPAGSRRRIACSGILWAVRPGSPERGAVRSPPMRLSAIVPTHERPHALRRCLETLQRQSLDGSQFEVIVVDDGSRSDLGALVERIGRAGPVPMRFHRQPLGGLNRARNRGIEVAQRRGRGFARRRHAGRSRLGAGAGASVRGPALRGRRRPHRSRARRVRSRIGSPCATTTSVHTTSARAADGSSAVIRSPSAPTARCAAQRSPWSVPSSPAWIGSAVRWSPTAIRSSSAV